MSVYQWIYTMSINHLINITFPDVYTFYALFTYELRISFLTRFAHWSSMFLDGKMCSLYFQLNVFLALPNIEEFDMFSRTLCFLFCACHFWHATVSASVYFSYIMLFSHARDRIFGFAFYGKTNFSCAPAAEIVDSLVRRVQWCLTRILPTSFNVCISRKR